MFQDLSSPLVSFSFPVTSLSQQSFAAAVKLYDKGDYAGAVTLFEDALVEYYKADVECRALCQGPQTFEGHDHVRYRYSLLEVVSGKTKQVRKCIHLVSVSVLRLNFSANINIYHRAADKASVLFL